ncbi:MAG: helix-turn-helix domain-containing protein, partial [Sphaerochaetaceae bacterium]
RLILPETRLVTRGGAVEVIPVVSTARLDSRIAVHVSNIKVSSIEKLLIDNSLSGRTAFAFVRDDGKLIYSSDRQLFSPEHLGIFQKMESKNPYGEYFLFKEVSESSGWTYLALVNKKDINGALNGSVPIVIALGLLLVLGGIGLALLFSFQIYLPINQAAEKLPSCEKKNRRPDELKLLSEGIDQLLLNEDAHRKEYLTYSLLLLINGLQGDDLNQVTEMTRLCLGFSFSRYLCAVLLFDNQGQYFDNDFLNEQDLSIDKFFHFSIPCIPLSLHGGLYACIFNLDPTAESRAAVVRKLSQSQELYVSKNICLYIGIGNSCDTLKKLSISYNQALAALKTCNRDQCFDLVEFSQLPVKNQVAFSFYDQKAIVNNIQSGNASALSRYLEELFIRNEKRGISKENQLELYHQVFLVGQRCLDDQRINPEGIEGYQGIRQFFSQGEGDGRKLLLDFFLDVQRSVYVPSQGGAEFKLADEARRYLEQNFQKPLSLDMIAGDLGISAKYLSRVFKAVTGENISFALSRIRMEKAKLLLSDDNVRIGEVALAVGMDSRATFLRVFKKIVGVNPSEYKAIALQEENDNQEEKI